MKKFFTILCCLCCNFFMFSFISCNGLLDNSKGSLRVSNKASIKASDGSEYVITKIFVHDKSSDVENSWVEKWTGELKNGESYFIELEPGEYSVMLYINNKQWPWESGSGNTGYKNYKRLKKGDFIYVAFDGQGVYWE